MRGLRSSSGLVDDNASCLLVGVQCFLSVNGIEVTGSSYSVSIASSSLDLSSASRVLMLKLSPMISVVYVSGVYT
jgi:hypothetical protein